MSRARQARELVRGYRSGVLSSHSAKFPGYPYGSALPYVCDQAGRPVVLISHLAEHTHNIEADPRASFIVCASGPDLQAQPRVTILGTAQPAPDQRASATRYLRFYPEHEQYLQIGGFRFFAIDPVQVRYIQGFGGLHWILGESYLAGSPLEAAAADILQHMNEDHADALRDYCRHVHGVTPAHAEMVGIDGDGFDVSADGALLRIPFPEPVANPGQVRGALIALANASRGRA